MQIKKIDLYEYFGIKKNGNYDGLLTVYSHGLFNEINPERKRPVMLVLGGGGYGFVSEREKEPIALKYFAEGFDAFVLEYTVAPKGYYPSELIEACMAVKYIRENADKLHVFEDKIATVGFSAGGHLLGMLCTLHNSPEVTSVLGKGNYRPDAAVFSYPVILNNRLTHGGSMSNLTKDNKELISKLGITDLIDSSVPPAFIWCTANDGCVPSENSLYLALKYKEVGVPFELHVFEDGVHGLSTCSIETANKEMPYMVNKEVSKWIPLSVKWLNKHGFKVVE